MSDRPKKLKRVPLKEELVVLTGCFVKALILQQFLYWSERVFDFDDFIAEEKERSPDLTIEFRYGWIYKSSEQLHDELMLGDSLSPRTVKRRIDEIVDAGYLVSRNNPKHLWDRCLQYRPDIIKIQIDLKEKGYALEGYPLFLQSSAFDTVSNASDTVSNRLDAVSDRSVASVQAIPETTIETTIETKKEDKEKLKINFELPPSSHFDLDKAWVYLKRNDDLIKAFVSGVTPKRMKLAIEGEDGVKMYNPAGRIFYQNGHAELQRVVIGEQDSSSGLTSPQLAMKNRLIDLIGAANELTEAARRQKIVKCQEAGIFMSGRGDTIQEIDNFDKWFPTYWQGQNGEPITLGILSKLWVTCKEETNGQQTQGSISKTGESGRGALGGGSTSITDSPKYKRMQENGGIDPVAFEKARNIKKGLPVL